MRWSMPDLVTQWIQSYPCETKSAQETQRNLTKFLRPEENPRSIHTDTSLDVINVCEELNWNHKRSTPRRSKIKLHCRASCTTSERRNFVSFGSIWTSRKLVGRIFDMCKTNWQMARHFYERRFNSPYEGPIIPSGAEVQFYPETL